MVRLVLLLRIILAAAHDLCKQSLVLPEGRVSLQQFVEHASEGEPIGRRIVGSALRQNLGRHVAVGAHRRVGLLLAEVARQAKVGDSHVAVLV